MIKKVIREWVELAGISALIVFVWQTIELIFIKKINPNIVDTIVAIPMVLLLHSEYKRTIRNIE